MSPTYAQLRAGAEPSTWLIDALAMSGQRRGRALDIGAGALNNTRALLRQGFTVDAVDVDPLLLPLARQIDDRRLNAIHADIRDLAIEPASYDLVVAIHVLPMLGRDDLLRTLSTTVGSVRPGGLLCCTLFGVDDGWARIRPRMSFVTRCELDTLFAPLHPLAVTELHYVGVDARDLPKRWHVFRCLWRKTG